jgi:hypothetical protein
MTPPIPEPRADDDEDVRWALSTAGSLWARGDSGEALKWLRRAAEAASDAGRDDRSLELFKVAADVTGRVQASTPAPPPVAARSAPPAPPMHGSRPPPLPPRASGAPPPLPATPRPPQVEASAATVPAPRVGARSPGVGRSSLPSVAAHPLGTPASSPPPPPGGRPGQAPAGAQAGAQAPKNPKTLASEMRLEDAERALGGSTGGGVQRRPTPVVVRDARPLVSPQARSGSPQSAAAPKPSGAPAQPNVAPPVRAPNELPASAAETVQPGSSRGRTRSRTRRGTSQPRDRRAVPEAAQTIPGPARYPQTHLAGAAPSVAAPTVPLPPAAPNASPERTQSSEPRKQSGERPQGTEELTVEKDFLTALQGSLPNVMLDDLDEQTNVIPADQAREVHRRMEARNARTTKSVGESRDADATDSRTDPLAKVDAQAVSIAAHRVAVVLDSNSGNLQMLPLGPDEAAPAGLVGAILVPLDRAASVALSEMMAAAQSSPRSKR